jgi:adenine phosphoribosyltransferase
MEGSVATDTEDLVAALKASIPTYADFPAPGIAFKDITPLLADGDRFAATIDWLCARLESAKTTFEAVLAIESRGFVFGAPIAARFRSGLVLVRKPGKLPGLVESFDYTCEYCAGRLEVERGAIEPLARYLIVDDLLATGGTARAVADYVAQRGGAVAGYCFLVELSFLDGRALLGDAPVFSLLTY